MSHNGFDYSDESRDTIALLVKLCTVLKKKKKGILLLRNKCIMEL